jgi:hypothetical protein
LLYLYDEGSNKLLIEDVERRCLAHMQCHKDSRRSPPRVLNCSAHFNDTRREKTNVSNHCKSKQTASRRLLLFVYCPMKRNRIQLTRNVAIRVASFALQTGGCAVSSEKYQRLHEHDHRLQFIPATLSLTRKFTSH